MKESMSLSTAKMPYLKENPINLSHTIRENDKISNYGSTMERGIHHGQAVVLAGSSFFYSSSFHRHGNSKASVVSQNTSK